MKRGAILKFVAIVTNDTFDAVVRVLISETMNATFNVLMWFEVKLMKLMAMTWGIVVMGCGGSSTDGTARVIQTMLKCVGWLARMKMGGFGCFLAIVMGCIEQTIWTQHICNKMTCMA